MGTGTAQLLVGSGHLYHDGIIPTHRIYLIENGRPAIIMAGENLFMFKREHVTQEFIWIPTVENMLDDIFLMIAVFIVRDKKLLKYLNKYNCNYKSRQFVLYDNLMEDEREYLYEYCKNVVQFPKIVLTVLNESTIKNQIEGIINYRNLEIDVCVSNKQPPETTEL